MRFKHDPAKAAANLKKHGVSFTRERNEITMRAEYDFSKGKRGAVIPRKGKTRISIFIDDVVLDQFRARAEKAGPGYQTMMNEALRRGIIRRTKEPLTPRKSKEPSA